MADLHLSDLPNTAACAALQWAVERVNQEMPDFLAVAGDITSFGTAASARQFAEAMMLVQVPVFLTPGNAELRSPGALPYLKPMLLPERRFVRQGNLLTLLPDTSTGALPVAEREWVSSIVAMHPEARRIVITHYPLDMLRGESRDWLAAWLDQQRVELLAVGHVHRYRRQYVGRCLEIATRGLDPDKAIGDLPGLSLLESATPGKWSERFLPWSPAIQLVPTELPGGASPIGWSIHGDPVDAAQETLGAGLSCLELRPRDLHFSRTDLAAALQRLRERSPLFLSYHLPGLGWNSDTAQIEGQANLRAHLDCALELGVNSLTMHVPQVLVREMELSADNGPQITEQHQMFLDAYAQLFRHPVQLGIRLAIENLHNPPQTPANSVHRRFATQIDEYLRWLDAVEQSMADIPQAMVGALLDVGHARNNGGDLDNMQPLCDWYARLGHRILGYHIHQVDVDPETGKTANHREITGLFSKRISYAGFLWAWSTHQMTRAPLFVEVRGDEARRNTARLFHYLFENAHEIRDATDLLGRQMHPKRDSQ